MSKPKLTPPDRARCQAERRTGSFLSMGRPGFIRCISTPSVIARERKPGRDGQVGEMSLCEDCRLKLEQQQPNYATYRQIRRKR